VQKGLAKKDAGTLLPPHYTCVDLLFESADFSIWPFSQQQHVFCFAFFRLGLYLALNRIGLSGQ